jgi:hypothetical protein
MRRRCCEATVNDSCSSKVHRHEGYLSTVQIMAVIFIMLPVSLPSFSSPAATTSRRRGQRPGHHDKVPASTASGAAGSGLGNPSKYLRCATSGAAGYGLGTTIKHLRRTTRDAPGSGPGTTANYLRGAAGIGLGTTIKFLRRTTRQRPGYHGQVSATHNERRGGKRYGHRDQVPAAHNEAAAWVPRPSTCDAQRAAPRATAGADVCDF